MARGLAACQCHRPCGALVVVIAAVAGAAIFLGDVIPAVAVAMAVASAVLGCLGLLLGLLLRMLLRMLLWLLRFSVNLPRQIADPEGVAHGCATFFYEAGCRLEKSLRRSTPLREVCTGKAFSLVRFFDAYQRNELGRAAGETLLILAF